jgi:hypothetical protein
VRGRSSGGPAGAGTGGRLVVCPAVDGVVGTGAALSLGDGWDRSANSYPRDHRRRARGGDGAAGRPDRRGALLPRLRQERRGTTSGVKAYQFLEEGSGSSPRGGGTGPGGLAGGNASAQVRVAGRRGIPTTQVPRFTCHRANRQGARNRYAASRSRTISGRRHGGSTARPVADPVGARGGHGGDGGTVHRRGCARASCICGRLLCPRRLAAARDNQAKWILGRPSRGEKSHRAPGYGCVPSDADTGSPGRDTTVVGDPSFSSVAAGTARGMGPAAAGSRVGTHGTCRWQFTRPGAARAGRFLSLAG